MDNSQKTMETIVNLAKGRGFVYPGSEIYGGLANAWDYGPLGVELKNNIKRAWWKKFVQENPYNVGLDSAIIMNPETWVASGHLGGFSDPLMDCRQCKTRHRADKLIEDYVAENGLSDNPAAWTDAEMMAYIKEHKIESSTEFLKFSFVDYEVKISLFKNRRMSITYPLRALPAASMN